MGGSGELVATNQSKEKARLETVPHVCVCFFQRRETGGGGVAISIVLSRGINS